MEYLDGVTLLRCIDERCVETDVKTMIKARD